MDNKIDLIELKHNIEMLRTTFNAHADISSKFTPEDKIYERGIRKGYEQASGGYLNYINRLEKLLEGVNIYE